MAPRVRLPYVAVQPSLPHVVADLVAPDSTVAAEDCWVSCYAYSPDHKSVHAKIRLAEADDRPRQVECSVTEGPIQVDMVSQSQFTVACPDLSIPATTILFPNPSANSLGFVPTTTSLNPTTQELPPPLFYRLATRGRRGGIETFTLSNDGGRKVLVGGADGLASVVDVVHQLPSLGGSAQQSSTRLIKGNETPLRGHVGDITDAAFFPSNEVVLTASSDMTLRVFSALDGSSPRTLKGHSKRVTACHVLASPTRQGPHKGRMVLSASLDGTIRLWDVSTSKNERTWTLQQPISKLVVLLGPAAATDDDDDVEASDPLRGRWALAAHTDGSVSLVDLGAGLESEGMAPVVFRTLSPSPIDAISTLGGWVATASRNGIVSLFHSPALLDLKEGARETTRVEAAPVVEWSRTEGSSSILDVELSSRVRTGSPPHPDHNYAQSLSILVAPSDGLAYRAVITTSPSEPKNADEQLVPPDVGVAVAEEFVGPDCEPATCIREDEHGRVWISAGGTDGGLRVYERAES
ncbi:hypothetical protein JCM3774_005788 [Rhodotorula dairenensis]